MKSNSRIDQPESRNSETAGVIVAEVAKWRGMPVRIVEDVSDGRSAQFPALTLRFLGMVRVAKIGAQHTFLAPKAELVTP